MGREKRLTKYVFFNTPINPTNWLTQENVVYRNDSVCLVRESWCCVALCTREMYGPLGSERNHILVDRGQLRVQTGTQAIQEPVNAHTVVGERYE